MESSEFYGLVNSKESCSLGFMGKNIILVGPNPELADTQNPGGQLTASIGLMHYANMHGFEIEVLNTLRSSFPPPPNYQIALLSVQRIWGVLNKLVFSEIDGVIIFCGAGKSFYERICIAALAKIFKVRTLFLIRDGWFLEQVLESSRLKRRFIRRLLQIPYRIGGSGSKWIEMYEDIGVDLEKTVLIRNWLPIDFSPSAKVFVNSEARNVRFVFVGWLIEEKGIYELLEAISNLYEHYDFQFTFVGGGTLFDSVKEYVAILHKPQRIRVMGWLSREELHQCLSDSDVFILPSYAEGFPNSLIEAMALGLPAICTDVGGVSDTLIDEETGFLIEPRCSHSLQTAMKKYLDEPELISRHSKAAYEMILENHTSEENCGEVFSVFKEI